MIKYDKLWQKLEEKEISQNMLMREYGISSSVLYRLRYNESVSMYTIDKLCNILGCDIGDIVMHYRD